MNQTPSTVRADLFAVSPLRRDFVRTRQASLTLAAPLAPEDTVVQSMPDTSPVKWHLAHTTWFFEEFVLQQQPGYRFYNERWRFLFNSYYQAAGPMHARNHRGLLSRPFLAEVLAYRAAVDAAIVELIESGLDAELSARIALGVQHEKQHQELILTDVKHLFWCHPLLPAYRIDLPQAPQAGLNADLGGKAAAQDFVTVDDGLVEIGADTGAGFVFDCETPRHRALLQPYSLARRPVSNGEYLQFIRAGGYRSPSLWLSDGWVTLNAEGWMGPMYWDAAGETEFTLAGVREIDLGAPVCHISYYEADAYARWADARLPTEAEWEHAAATQDANTGHYADAGAYQPQAVRDSGDLFALENESTGKLLQLFGDVWEWTASPYTSYPGFKPLPGTLGEYNGKFMCGQWVLRGGSCVTPAGHVRASYRNFFRPRDRWQFSGFRLAR